MTEAASFPVPVKEYTLKIPEVERRLDDINEAIAELQEHLKKEAHFISSDHSRAIKKIWTEGNVTEGSRYHLRVSQNGPNMVKMEWAEYRRDWLKLNGGKSYPVYMLRDRENPIYVASCFGQAPEWELRLIVEAENQLGYIRVISKALSDMKTRLRNARTHSMTALAHLTERANQTLELSIQRRLDRKEDPGDDKA